MYKEVFTRNNKKFVSEEGYTLSPLGVVFAELFDEMSFEEHITCLQMLGSEKIDNYSEEIIDKMYG